MHTRTYARQIHGGLSIKDLPISIGMYSTKELPLPLSNIELSTLLPDGAAGKSHICNLVTEKVTTRNNCLWVYGCVRAHEHACVRACVYMLIYLSTKVNVFIQMQCCRVKLRHHPTTLNRYSLAELHVTS